MTPITITTNTPGTPIRVDFGPVGIAITPDGTTVYVTNPGHNTVTPIAVATNTPGTPIPVDDVPVGIAITPAPPASATTSTTLSVQPGSPAAAGTVQALSATITPLQRRAESSSPTAPPRSAPR